MGSAESREGRRASFGMDEEERVRVLQGIRLSENVVNRMKEPDQPSKVGPLAPPAAALGSSGGREKDSKPPRPDCGSGRGPPQVQVDPLERCDWEQAVLQDKLVHVATTEREAAANPRSVTLRRGEGVVDQEKQRLAQRAHVPVFWCQRHGSKWDVEASQRSSLASCVCALPPPLMKVLTCLLGTTSALQFLLSNNP
ncbi:MICOS complex subunit MIC25 isoform X4 [Bubalus kerabau]|uniref:MICOS complex subunit MIC25 isoform X4 n=1 Tax=Bubalus carabanensis TaxID=3119969 RepID=UPI00244EC686|nr:MICOS complex subunit MIC25 isoform X4 [Bubalus carabanensis]